MYSIIPLAGPDFIHPQLGIKPLFKIDGVALISKILNSRIWVKNQEVVSENMIFVLRDIPESEEFEHYIKKEFLDCKIVKIPDFTKGALMSVLAATSMIKDFTQPIIFDLVDIDFTLAEKILIREIFSKNSDIGAILPYFKSNDEAYSYANVAPDGFISETKEKKGWEFNNHKSLFGNASAGVYIFRDLEIFLKAAADSINNFQLYSHNDRLFLCPAMNGVVKNQKKVFGIEVSNVNSVGLKFK